jgi:hypothetical protein
MFMKAFRNLVVVKERGCQRIFITDFTEARTGSQIRWAQRVLCPRSMRFDGILLDQEIRLIQPARIQPQ